MSWMNAFCGRSHVTPKSVVTASGDWIMCTDGHTAALVPGSSGAPVFDADPWLAKVLDAEATGAVVDLDKLRDRLSAIVGQCPDCLDTGMRKCEACNGTMREEHHCTCEFCEVHLVECEVCVAHPRLQECRCKPVPVRVDEDTFDARLLLKSVRRFPFAKAQYVVQERMLCLRTVGDERAYVLVMGMHPAEGAPVFEMSGTGEER